MTKTSLDAELQELNAQILQLGILGDRALEEALDALMMGDREEVAKVIRRDNDIDNLHLLIEEHTFRILSLQHPVFGYDLRFLTSAVPIAIDLERIGDEAEEIAQDVRRMVPFEDVKRTATVQLDPEIQESIRQRLFALGHEVRVQLQQTMKAFAERDAQAAYTVWSKDSLIDKQYYEISRDLTAGLEQHQSVPISDRDLSHVQHVVYLLWIAHALERAADHCTNICERIVFMVEGETDINADIRLAHQPESL
jgi:phosphate transport system protein